MATGSTTMVASSRVASSLFGVMETSYWSRLSDSERDSCFGEVSQLVCQGKTAWNIAGCLEQHWRLDLSGKVAEICNNPNNMRRIYRRHRHRPNVVTDLYLFGYVGRQSEAFPAIVVISANGSIAKRLADLLRCHESIKLPAFEVLHLEVKVNLLVGEGKQHDRPGVIVSSSSIPEEFSDEEFHESSRPEDGEWSHQESESVYDGYRSSLSLGAASWLSSSSTLHSTYSIGSSMSDSSGSRLGNSKSTLNPRMPRLDEKSFEGARSSIIPGTQSLCGSRVVTSALPSDPSSSWRQFTTGGVISLEGKLFGMTVAHPFFEPAAFLGCESSISSLPSSDSGQDEDFESDSQDDRGRAMHATPSISHSSSEIYLDNFEILMQKQPLPTAASFSRLGARSALSTIGTFTADQSFAPKYWSSELDWALFDITEQQFMSTNLVSTTHGVITPSSVKKKQDLAEARVVVASGVSGIIYTRVHSTVAQIILPMSTKMHEVWKIDCVCAPGDCGAWVICPDTGAIYGIVVAASPSLQLTYILPAELVFENLMARWNMDLSQTKELLLFGLSADSRPEPCHLTPLGQRFARIRVGQIKECVNFIVSEQAVLKEDPQNYLREAVVLYRNSKPQDAQACVQQALIIDQCSGLDKDDIQDYLSDLIALRKSTVSKLLDNVDKTFAAVKTKSDASTPLANTGPRHTTTADRGRHIPTQGKYSLGDAQTQRSPSPTTSDLVNQFSSVNINPQRLPSVPSWTPHEAAYANRHRPPTGSRAYWSSAGNRAAFIAPQIEDVNIRSNEGEFEPLDPRYRQRRDKVEYFIVGRVFAVLWHENLGITNKKPGPDVQFTRDNRFGEKIFSHMRRMVVIRQRYGYCWCVSINTYGGRGLVGKRAGDAELQSHTIVYESTSRPAIFKEEQGLMSKEPIAVDMVSGHALDKASRLNYAKVFTVEHNVKVMNIGMVSSRSMPYLLAHWRDETAN